MSSYEDIQYVNGDRRLKGVWISPKKRKEREGVFPTILMVPGIYGIRDGEIDFAQQLSELGFAVLIHDWLSADKNPSDPAILDDLAAAISYLKAHADVDQHKIGLIGFCRGGTIALLAAGNIDDFACIVDFYGQAIYPETNEDKPVSAIELVNRIQAPLCIIHGEADTVYPVEQTFKYKEALESRGAELEFRSFENGAHAFFLPGSPNYNEQLAKEATPFVLSFLTKHLQH